MKNISFLLAIFVMSTLSVALNAQNKDKAIFIVKKPGFYENSILRDDT